MEPRGDDCRLGAASALVCHRWHGGGRREIAGRGRCLGRAASNGVRVLRFRRRRCDNRGCNGALPESLVEAFRAIQGDFVGDMDRPNPDKLSAAAAERKSAMLLLPYGIPIAIGTIAYFAFSGMFL